MAKIGAFVGQASIDGSTPADNVSIPVTYVVGPPQSYRGAVTVNVNIQTNGEAQLQEIIRNAIVADINALFGSSFVARDVRIIDGSPDGFLVCGTVAMSTLTVADDVATFLNVSGHNIRVRRLWASARVLTLGTATVIVKNALGNTVGSIPLASPGPVFNDIPTSPPNITVMSGGRLRFGFTGIGTGLVDVTAGLWYVAPGTDI